MIEEITVSKPTFTVKNIKAMYLGTELLEPLGNNIPKAKVSELEGKPLTPKSIAAVFNIIKKGGGPTKTTLAIKSKLSKGCVGRVVRYLESKNEVVVTKDKRLGPYSEWVYYMPNDPKMPKHEDALGADNVIEYLKANGDKTRPQIVNGLDITMHRLKKALDILLKKEIIKAASIGKVGKHHIFKYSLK